MQKHRLTVARASFDLVDLRIDVAIGDEEVEPGVVVHIEEGSAPADVGITGLTDTGGPAHVIETFRAHVAIERIGLVLEMGDEETEMATVVVVAPVDAHIAELHAFPA